MLSNVVTVCLGFRLLVPRRGSVSVVGFPDDVTLELETERGARQFMYDQCFGPAATQEEVH